MNNRVLYAYEGKKFLDVTILFDFGEGLTESVRGVLGDRT